VKAATILDELQRRGVSVALDGNTLCLRPGRALDEALLARVREAKPAILEALRKAPAKCWHCNGSGECECATCGVMKPSVVWAAGECVACKARKAHVQ